MTAQQNISELLEGIKQGDQIAESKFVKKYEGIIFAIAVRDVSSIDDAIKFTENGLKEAQEDKDRLLRMYLLNTLAYAYAKKSAKEKDRGLVEKSLDYWNQVEEVHRELSYVRKFL